MGYPVKEIMGYRTGNRTVDMVKKYTIVILDFYKPLAIVWHLHRPTYHKAEPKPSPSTLP